MCSVVDEGGEDGALGFQVLVIDSGGKAHEVRDTRGVGEVPHVGIELVPLEIVAQRGTPVRQQFEHVGSREVELLLLVAVVDGQLRGVAIHVVGVVIGILCQPSCREAFTDVLVVGSLEESVEVLLPFTAPPHVVDDGTRDAAGGVIKIAFQLPRALIELSEEVGLDALGVDVTILSDGCRVPGRLSVGIAAFVAELVLAAGRKEACAHATADGLGEALLP